MIFADMRGTKVPALGFGTWQLTGSTCERAVAAALEIGYRHIDTAQVYENEAEVGRAIAGSKLARSDIFLTTKVWMASLAGPKVAPSVEQSLRKLRTDYVDLLLIHWPNAEVPLAETLDAFAKLKSAGKVRAIGVSNFTVALMEEAVGKLGKEIACNQVEYHLLLSQTPVLDYARKHGIVVTAYCPLARGKLAGNPVIERVARKHGKSLSQVALRWLVEQKNVTAIPRTSTEKHARENFDIFDFELDAEDRRALDALPAKARVVNPGWSPDWDAA
jgi:2,5-diketo-D-gluconate reductase B